MTYYSTYYLYDTYGNYTGGNPMSAPASNWQNTAMRGYNYYLTSDASMTGNPLSVQPTDAQFKTGFTHFVTGIAYFARGSETDPRKVLQFQIDVLDARIAVDCKQVTDLKKAQVLLDGEPELVLLLDLHKKGYL